jgi:hypothetical protein
MRNTFRRFPALVLLLLGGCMMMQPQMPDQTFNGTLRSVKNTSGQVTGWVLQMGDAGMGASHSLPLDVSEVKDQVMQLEGKEVVVTCQMKQGSSTMVVKSIGTVSQ